jgi:hypothetical protein
MWNNVRFLKNVFEKFISSTILIIIISSTILIISYSQFQIARDLLAAVLTARYLIHFHCNYSSGLLVKWLTRLTYNPRRGGAWVRSRPCTYKVVNTKRVCRMRLKPMVPFTRVSMPGQAKYPTQVDSSLHSHLWQKSNRVMTPCNDKLASQIMSVQKTYDKEWYTYCWYKFWVFISQRSSCIYLLCLFVFFCNLHYVFFSSEPKRSVWCRW